VAKYEIPDDLYYTREDEWARLERNRVTIGITDYAQQQLGDIVFVELPDTGRDLEGSRAFGVVESVKAVSDLFAPIAGEVVETNDALTSDPELVNSDPYGEGWMIRLRVAADADLGDLLDAAAYDDLVAAG